jgi:hypothetical protein
MIPERLQIKGFLSYYDPVDVDFSGIDLAVYPGRTVRASPPCSTPSPGHYLAKPAAAMTPSSTTVPKKRTPPPK